MRDDEDDAEVGLVSRAREAPSVIPSEFPAWVGGQIDEVDRSRANDVKAIREELAGLRGDLASWREEARKRDEANRLERLAAEARIAVRQNVLIGVGTAAVLSFCANLALT